MLLSTTIDFNDNVFAYDGPEAYYPLEQYEADIRRLAENGIKKFYVRVNCAGLSNHPSKVVARYGADGAYHWTQEASAMRLIRTMERYDCCAETVRLAHRYGAEAWAWESLYDDAGVCVDRTRVPEHCMAAYRRKGGWYALDPFYLAHRDALAARDPLRTPSPERVAAARERVRQTGIGKMVFVNHAEWTGVLPPPRVTAENFKIYESDDNRIFRLYAGGCDFQADQTPDGRNRIVVSKLNLRSPYLKLVCDDTSGEIPFTMVLRVPEGQGELYDRRGELLPSGWAVNQGSLENAPLDFRCIRGNAAWDCDDCYLACCAGEPDLAPCLYGFAEFNVPKAMAHKVARFEELTHYGFDGFMFNTRSHSAVNFAEQYGYNPEVLAKFRARFGRDYAGSAEDIDGVFQIRGEGVAEFFRRCKALTGGRPLFMSAPMPREYREHPAYNPSFGPMPWLYKRFFAEGSIDGVIMIGKNFENGVDYSEYFTPEVTAGRPIKLGIFREMFGRPEGYDLGADLARLRNSGLDEVELYESVMLNRNPRCLPFLRGDAGADAEMSWTWHL